MKKSIILMALIMGFTSIPGFSQNNEPLGGSLLYHKIQLAIEDYCSQHAGCYPKTRNEINIFKANFVKNHPSIRNVFTNTNGIDSSVVFILVDKLKPASDTFQIKKPMTPGMIIVGLETTGCVYRLDITNDKGFIDNSGCNLIIYFDDPKEDKKSDTTTIIID